MHLRNVSFYEVKKKDSASITFHFNTTTQITTDQQLELSFTAMLNELKTLFEENKFITEEHIEFTILHKSDKSIALLKDNHFFKQAKISPTKIQLFFNDWVIAKVISDICQVLDQFGMREFDVNPSAFNFYTQQGGKEILKDNNYPEELTDYLASERDFIINYIKKWKDKYTTLFEIGCGEARNLDIARQCGLNYYGIDFDADHISNAEAKIKASNLSDSAKVKCLSIFNLSQITTPTNPQERVLCIFPFNALGNMGNLLEILSNLYSLNFDILISTYKTDEFSSSIREKYFINCGYKDLKKEHHKHGVMFSSGEGLKSTALDEKYVQGIADIAKYSSDVHVFSAIGMMYVLSHPGLIMENIKKDSRFNQWAHYIHIKKHNQISINLDRADIKGLELSNFVPLMAENELKLNCLSLSYNKNMKINDLLSLISECENTLEYLYLLATDFSDDALSQLSEFLAGSNIKLNTLDMGLNNITNEGVISLAEAISKNPNIKYISLNRNPIGDAGAKTLIEVLEKCNHTISNIDLGQTYVNQSLLDKINQLLTINRKKDFFESPTEKANYIGVQKNIPRQPPSLLQVSLFAMSQYMANYTKQEKREIYQKLPTTLCTKIKRM